MQIALYLGQEHWWFCPCSGVVCEQESDC